MSLLAGGVYAGVNRGLIEWPPAQLPQLASLSHWLAQLPPPTQLWSNFSLPTEAKNQVLTLSQRALTSTSQAQKVLGTAVEVNETATAPSLSDRAWSSAQYYYCLQVVKSHEEKNSNGTPTPSPISSPPASPIATPESSPAAE